jgi:ATP adenylyltransferase
MDRMWSPWRSEYVSEAAGRPPSDGASIFTTLLNENEDAENLILWRGEEVFVIMNLYPYNNGHLLIVPYREVEAYTALTVAEQRAVAATIDRCIEWLHAALAPEGVNVGMNLARRPLHHLRSPPGRGGRLRPPRRLLTTVPSPSWPPP